MTILIRPSLRFAAAALALATLSAPILAAEDFSPAERALFMTNHLAGTKPPTTLRYSFSKAGSMEEGFEDKVAVKLKAAKGGKCCLATAEFLSGAHRLSLPEVDQAQGNPAVLYFLERDIREMNRLTKGQQNYFRKRIRMAVYQGAQVQDVTVSYRGKSVPAREIRIAPYVDDPLRVRFEKLANKTYVFTLSDAVPGGLYAIRTRIAGETADAAPLIVEEMLVDGGTASPR
ncbi:MAG: hypothetical protein AB7U92_08905 [Piscinibacter sp.]|uniref:hypothetical protein n=1 Tax=Piscinibacter sp. TaxID=1903157 RepID=UPI003D11E8E0